MLKAGGECPSCGGELVETFSDEKRIVLNCRTCGCDQIVDACAEEVECS